MIRIQHLEEAMAEYRRRGADRHWTPPVGLDDPVDLFEADADL